MNEELQEQLVKRFTNRFSKFNEKVLEELGLVINQIGELIPSDAYKLAQQLKYNTTIKELENELARITGKSIEEIQKILKHVAKENIAFSAPFYEAKGLNAPGELKRIVNSMARLSAESFINIARSTGFRLLDADKKPLFLNLEETYHRVIDEAVYAVTTGKESYNQLMRNTLKQLAHSGVRNIEYESGYTRRIDTAVRMNVMDSIRQVSYETSKQLGKEFGSDGVEIAVHAHPAPDHAHAQGRQFSHEEFEKFQNHESCKDYQGYIYGIYEGGIKRRAIQEYNCYHDILEIVLGISKPLHSDEELKKIIDDNNKGVEIDGKQYTIYEATQLQRRIETEIRKSKEENILAKASGDEELVLSSQQRITSLMNKYKQISKQSNLAIDIDRTYVPDYKPKKIKTNSNYEDITERWLKSVGEEKGTRTNQEFFIDKQGNRYDDKNATLIFDHTKSEESIAEWYAQTKHKNIKMLPRVIKPKEVKSADFIEETSGITWEIKEPEGNTKNTTMLNQFKGQKEKAGL